MADTFTIIVDFNNPWVQNKTIQLDYASQNSVRDALYAAYDKVHASDPDFTFDLRYYGKGLGDFVQTLCGVPTTISSSWEIFLNGAPATSGIDSIVEKPGDTVIFRYVLDRDESHGTARAKREASRGKR